MCNHDTATKTDSTSFELEHFEPGTVLVRYFEKTVAASDGNRSYEIALEAADDPARHLMTVYNSDGVIVKYSVPWHVYSDCNGIITANGMPYWNDMKDNVSLDGAVISCRFLYKGEYICASSDCMPAQGETVFRLLKRVLGEAMNDENRK